MSKAVDDAKRILRGEAAATEALFKLGKSLKGEQKFDLARRIFRQAAEQGTEDDVLRRKVAQQWASSTEKDPDLPLDRRFAEAHAVIEPVLKEAKEFARRPAAERAAVADSTVNEHQETFGIAAAIHKRWWQADPQPYHLIRALELYEKGYRLGVEPERAKIPDQGYTGVNAAFVLDLLAEQETASGNAAQAETRRARAREIRADILARLSALPEAARADWWTLLTLAEAALGLREYESAKKWLSQAAGLKETQQPWEYETAVKQFARIAMMQENGASGASDFVHGPAWEALENFVGADQAGLFSAFSGKVGLALSGGGFRASLFHIGVLARLAEMDMLRHVEVLSCVSGGSIIGAHYYLKLRTLLEAKHDSEITREDYLKLVDEMEREFMGAIVTNPRMQVFSEVTKLGARTDRMGQLLDETLYGPVAGLARGERPLLRNLLVRPKDQPNFKPKYENWRRRHKVPILILNATTLNTGHNWQFTASFMGESPNNIDPEVDGNERLRRMYYEEEAPPPHDATPLGRAVAASAAVPGLFRPVRLSGLYPEREIELVDGGVHDNQGVDGLLEQDCTVLLVSDASGQLVSQRQPHRNEGAVLMRSNDTLMARVRELEHKELCARKRAGLLRDFMFVHLKKDLLVEPVNWNDCDLPKESRPRPGARPDSKDLTRYGVRGDVQNLLSGIRTDLDAFSEAEAFGLMASGYKMTAWDFPQSIRSFRPQSESDGRWRFLKIEELLSRSKESDHFIAALKLAGSLLFKGPSIHPAAGWIRHLGRTRLTLIALGILIGLGLLVINVPLALAALAIVFIALVIFIRRGGLYRATRIFDRLYLEKGSLAQVLGIPPSDR